METISPSLLTFLLNSLWQIPVAAAVAAVTCRLMRQGPAGFRHAVWVTALAAAVLLPLASIRAPQTATSLQYSPVLADAPASVPAVAHATAQPLPAAPGSAPRTISIAATIARMLLGAYLLFVLLRIARLGWACIRTARIRRGAEAREISVRLDRVRTRCQEAFGLSDVELLISPRISGPVAAGRTVILPESLLAETSDDVLTSAIGHEMAHIARRDFACNLLYEVLLLPVSFHPATWLIRRGIERTREMACDELVTRRLMDAGAYARSIVSIAAQMTALPRPGYTLGVFDGDILEERIRRLLERPAASLQRARLLFAGGLTALALCAVFASTMAFTARAQGAAGDLLKRGEQAFDRGDYATATAEFQAAVRFEPDNLEAKLSLAGAFMAQYVPGTDPSSPFLAGAKQQYQDVLARDASNRKALKNMMILMATSRQFAEAREWAQKAIQADSTCTECYYTAGFVDWSITYPDYMQARAAAGMRPQDSGFIPDPGLRENLRTQHGGHIEDGLRMLQGALQLQPVYSDAMAYINLLYRIKAAMADNTADYTALTAQADDWVGQALDAKRKEHAAAQTGASPNRSASTWMATPPPPPPPPPPPGQGVPGGVGVGVAGGVRDGVHQRVGVGQGVERIQVEGNIQQAQLLRQVPPAYPPAAAQAGVSGTVRLGAVIGKDGTIKNLEVLSGHPLLIPAALDAVKQWTYKPTLLNGEPVEVLTSINVTFNGR